MSQTDLIGRLRQSVRSHSADGEFVGADLRGADLTGVSLSLVSLAYAQLDDADLTGAQLTLVDLRGASLRKARLEHARFDGVDAGSAAFADVAAAESLFVQCNLSGADFANAGLQRAVIRGCTLQSARLDGANLAHALLVSSGANAASLRGANLGWTNTSETTFIGADFTGARRFFLCREIVAEILRRHVGDDPERAAIVGTIQLLTGWCYADWKRYLEARPVYRDLALDIFRDYPESGFSEALRAGILTEPGVAVADR